MLRMQYTRQTEHLAHIKQVTNRIAAGQPVEQMQLRTLYMIVKAIYFKMDMYRYFEGQITGKHIQMPEVPQLLRFAQFQEQSFTQIDLFELKWIQKLHWMFNLDVIYPVM